MHLNNAEEQNRKMIDIDPTKARIFHVTSDPPSMLSTVNGFVIRKALTSEIGTNHTCKRLKSGTLRVEVENAKQAQKMAKFTQIYGLPVTSTPPFASNTCKGVVSHYDFVSMTDDEIVEEMAVEQVIGCKQFFRTDRNTHQRVPSGTVCLTFATTVRPEKIHVGYDIRDVRPYMQKPIRCNKCQRYGHTQKTCRAKDFTCGKCSKSGHYSSSCTESEVKCAACEGPHFVYDRNCPVWVKENDIATVRSLQKMSYGEAKAKVEAVTQATPIPGVSYSQVAQAATTPTAQTQTVNTTKTFCTIGTQTETETIGTQTETETQTPKPNNVTQTGPQTQTPRPNNVTQTRSETQTPKYNNTDTSVRPKETQQRPKDTQQLQQPTDTQEMPPPSGIIMLVDAQTRHAQKIQKKNKQLEPNTPLYHEDSQSETEEPMEIHTPYKRDRSSSLESASSTCSSRGKRKNKGPKNDVPSS